MLKTIPPNESVTSADLYIKFALSKKIPKGANIIFESPSTLPWAPTGSFNNYVFLSKVYTSATVTGTTLTVTVNEEIK